MTANMRGMMTRGWVRSASMTPTVGAVAAWHASTCDGASIRHGELAYRDASDQKPPGIPYIYAGLRYVWPGDAVVPAADLVAAAIVTAVLWSLGSRLGGRAAGSIAGLLFLLLSDPSFAR